MTAEHEAAVQVARLLGQLENDLDAAFATAGALAVALPRARAKARLSAAVGRHALELLSRAMMTIDRACGDDIGSDGVGTEVAFDAGDHDDRAKSLGAARLVAPTRPRVAA